MTINNNCPICDKELTYCVEFLHTPLETHSFICGENLSDRHYRVAINYHIGGILQEEYLIEGKYIVYRSLNKTNIIEDCNDADCQSIELDYVLSFYNFNSSDLIIRLFMLL